jgi:hypothetical protein
MLNFFPRLSGLIRDLNFENLNLLNAKTITGNQEFSNGNSGSAATIQWSIAQHQSLTLTANCTLSFGSDPAGVCIATLRIVQDGTGGRTVSWPAGIKWQGSAPPILSTSPGAEDHIDLYWNGSSYFASASFNFATVPTPNMWGETPFFVIDDGDSITVGFNTNPVTSYPYLASLYYPPGCGFINVATNGETLAQMITNLPTNVYPNITSAHSAGQLAYVSIAGGGNDITAGGTASDVETRITTYVSDVIAHGADKVIGWTLWPRTTAGFETQRLTYNTWLRANFGSIGIDYLIDMGADPVMGPLAAASDTVLYVDGTHMTYFGQCFNAGHLVTAVLLNQSLATLTSLSTSSGSHAGGTVVTMTGTRFTKAGLVVLGGVPASTFAIQSDTSIVATTGVAVGAATGNGLASVAGPNGSAILGSGFTYT